MAAAFALKHAKSSPVHCVILADCDREIEQLLRESDGKNDPGQKPSPADPRTQKRTKNRFHFQMEPELKRIFGVDLTASHASHALRIAAQTLARSRTHLGSFYRRMRARLGAPQAIAATAHKLARIVYRLLTTGHAYDEAVFLQEDQKQPQRHEKHLRKQAQSLGFKLVPIAE